jgi:hypothetical protein
MMLTNTSFQVPNVSCSSLPTNIADVLISVRQEWELVAGGISLLHCESSVGLLLFDIVAKLGIPTEEQRRLLGSALFDDVTRFVTKQG